MQIGLFFGSFNPIHVGHLILGNAMSEYGGVNQVWFVVSPHNPLKKRTTLLHEFDRMDMVRLAIADHPKFIASDIEFHLPKPSYTIDTLTYLQAKYPQHQFKLIIGEDNLIGFAKWKNYEQILAYYELLVYRRHRAEVSPFHTHPKITFVDAPMVEISATYIRDSIQQGKSIRYLVHQDVETLIRTKKFYLT
jgi:nicotinate-nucleotide adenylyltransferase